MKSSVEEIPTILGTPMDGGFYAGRIRIGDQVFALIIAPKADGEHEDAPWNGVGLNELLAGRRTMNLETHILLRCPDCKREMEVQRDEHDYPEAVRVEVRCDECDDGDFAEVFQYDAAGKHITRDPSLPANAELRGRPLADGPA